MFRCGCDQKVHGAYWLPAAKALSSQSRGVNRYRLGDIQDFELRDELESLRESLSALMEGADEEFSKSGSRNREPLAGSG